MRKNLKKYFKIFLGTKIPNVIENFVRDEAGQKNNYILEQMLQNIKTRKRTHSVASLFSATQGGVKCLENI